MSAPGGITRESGEAPVDAATTVRRVECADRTSFLDAVGEALSFPPYYGRNLDALDECLRDLSWLPEGPVVLQWDDGPMRDADPDTHRLVLDLLDDVANDPDGSAAGGRPLTVALRAT